MKKFLVSWIKGDDLGIYEADDEYGATLKAVQDAGYSSLADAADFIYDDSGTILIQAVEYI